MSVPKPPRSPCFPYQYPFLPSPTESPPSTNTGLESAALPIDTRPYTFTSTGIPLEGLKSCMEWRDLSRMSGGWKNAGKHAGSDDILAAFKPDIINYSDSVITAHIGSSGSTFGDWWAKT
ncbi:hypothetical protein FRC11_014775, partial [Ceratobasidium sp. 423]